MYSKKKLKRLNTQFERDNELGYPYHKTDTEPEARAEFIKQLISHPSFVTTRNNNESRFKEPWKKIVKKFDAFDWFVALCFTLCGGGFAFAMTDASNPQSKIIQEHKIAYLAMMTTLGVMAGLVVGIINSIQSRRINEISNLENLYNKITVRLFDSMRAMYPDLDENLLKQCNPEMARVIGTLLMANMSESDTRKLQSVAEKIAKNINSMNDKNQISALMQYNRDLASALSVVEHNLITNNQLHDVILSVYRGNMPKTFVFQNDGKTK